MRPSVLALALLASCGTRGAPAGRPSNDGGAPAAPAGVILTIETTPCMGRCPIYTVTLSGDGGLAWEGGADTALPGHAERRVPPETVTAVIDAFAAARFFELDDSGRVHEDPQPVCVAGANGTQTCTYTGVEITVCTDTSHTITTFRHDGRAHTTKDAHCEETPLSRLEDAVVTLLALGPWIGAR